jgi:predicted protein tyrosine phosphatase
MAHPQLAIFGYSEAAMFLRGTPRPDVSAMISIHGAREFPVEADVAHRMDLTFDDIDVAAGDDMMAMHRAMSRKRWAEQNGLVEIAPSAADAAAIVRFAESVNHVSGIVLCHCGAGMSRAPAAALICLAVWNGADTEVDCVAEILRRRRGAVPHIGLVRFADELLQRDGKLVGALIVART